MNNFRLPTSGDANWGSTLNAYLENLNSKISNLEKQYSSASENSIVKNIGYASSGIVGKCDCIYDGYKEQISFTGNVFISGEINTYFSVSDIVYDTKLIQKSNIPYFIFLKYNTDNSFEIIPRQGDLEMNYTAILIGLFFRNETNEIGKFVPYYHSSLKTIMEIQNEIYSRWVDLESYNTFFTIKFKNKIPSDAYFTPRTNLSSIGGYALYCGGMNENAISKFYSNLNQGYIRINEKSGVLFLQDSVSVSADGSSSVITTVTKKHNLTTGNYFRILLDVFGQIIIQKSYIDYELSGPGYWREQQVLNIPFNNRLFNSGKMNASMWVEVSRFAYNSNDIFDGDLTYYQDPESTELDNIIMHNKLIFVKSITNGLAAQQSPRIWVTKDSEINLSKTTFTHTDNGDTNSFTLKNNNNTLYFKNSSNGEEKELVNTSDGQTVTLGFIYCDDVVADDIWSKTVTTNSVTFNEGGNLQTTSDRRRKENFSNIEESFLEVVNSVPVVSFNYKNSPVPQIGIIAQDLEDTNISNINCFVNIQDTLELKNKRSLYETKLIYILWKALQEETELRKKLEQRVADLEAK